jgi:hypothetical protein
MGLVKFELIEIFWGVDLTKRLAEELGGTDLKLFVK